MLQELHPLALLAFAVVSALALLWIGSRWRRPQVAGEFRSHAMIAGWVLGNGLLAAGAVAGLRVALGVTFGDGPLAELGSTVPVGEGIALVAVGLLVWFAEAETNRGLLLCGSLVAGSATLALSALIDPLGLRFQPGSFASVLTAAVAAPILLSIGSRATLIARVRARAMTAAGNHILVLDDAGRTVHVPADTLRTLEIETPVGSRDDLPKALRQLVRDGQARRARLRTRSGRIIEAWATRRETEGALARARGILVRDATGRYEDERRLVRLAHYDSLTGLPNRRLFLETLRKVLQDANRSSFQVALFYIDLDDFKAINDTHGHGAGDTLLETLAKRLLRELSSVEVSRFGLSESELTVARLSGDEFAVIAARIPDNHMALDLANFILETVAHPIELGERTLASSASVGIAIAPGDGDDIDTLIRHADTALYAAKTRGRRRCARYDPSFDENADRARCLEQGLQQAIARNELQLFYQPKVDTLTGEVVAFEALMRWHSQELGNVGPGEFIPVAESRGLITELGSWSLDRACRQIREWKEAGFAVVPVAVNVSSHQFKEADLQSIVSDALKEHEVEPRLLELELTESLLLDDCDKVSLVLRDLRSIGVRIALDDFGTGYSALTYLNRFNLDILKIDRGLLRDIASNPSAAGIVSAVVSMAHSLGLTVVAEGVDCPEQVPILREMHCDQIQGFLYSPAVPPDEVVRFLAREGAPTPVAGVRADSPGNQAAPLPSAIQTDDEPVPRSASASKSGESLEVVGPNQGRALIIDDEGESLGLTALRLSRLGIDVHYASAVDEAHLFVSQESASIRVLVVPPTIGLEGLRAVSEHLTELCGERRRIIVVGERPEDELRTAIREAGVDWVLWAPFNDTELRSLTKSAMALTSEIAGRRDPRVPVDMLAKIASGPRREVAVVSSLSPRGAFIEVNAPLPVGSSLRIEMDMQRDRFRGFARVVHARHDNPEQPYEPSGMGVRFFGLDRDTERILRKAVHELEARYLP